LNATFGERSGGIRRDCPEIARNRVPVRGVQKSWDGGRSMSQPEGQDLKQYLDEKFASVDAKFGVVNQQLTLLAVGQKGLASRLGKVESRLDGIDQHLDKQDADLEHRTKSILETIEASAKDSRLWASKLFAVLDQESARKKRY
jgi:hypothetical protein